MQKNDKNHVSHHILPTSSNLLALCFLLVTSIKAMGLANLSLVDDLTAGAIVIFLFSSIFSYAAMRSEKKSDIYERIADGIFLAGLAFLTIISLIITFEVVR
ncbi:MAG: hypothetical protein HGA78_05815 [Nitrospirales bacterium]|nr:hypothetical protein [Nitrospirales bacterium]